MTKPDDEVFRSGEMPTGWAYELILSYRNYYGTYHNQKEQMAYTAVALYLGAAGWLAFMDAESWNKTRTWQHYMLFAASALAAFLYIRWQLRNRQIAADIVAACTSLAARWLVKPPTSHDLQPVAWSGDTPSVLAVFLKCVTGREPRLLFGRLIIRLTGSKELTLPDVALLNWPRALVEAREDIVRTRGLLAGPRLTVVLTYCVMDVFTLMVMWRISPMAALLFLLAVLVVTFIWCRTIRN